MTITLERRLANFRAAAPVATGGGLADAAIRARVSAVGAERLAAEVDGELIHAPGGSFVRVERRSILVALDRERLASLPGQPPPDVPLLCLDTETTGLATASGTLAFLVGLGWWEGDRFRQVQLLLPDHADEPALLDALRAHVPADGWLVTYNGRGFDWPLLVARYRMTRSGPPVHDGHLDLLPIVRRYFRHRMPNARLQTVETELLGLNRHDDVPGWEIPARYLQFLRDGDPASLLAIVRHNEEDVRSLARLLAHIDQRLADPVARAGAPAGDLAGLACALTASRRFCDALECVEAALAGLDRQPALAPTAPRPAAPPAELHRVREDADPWWSPRRRPDFGGRQPVSGGHGTWSRVSPAQLDAPWTADRLRAERARLLRRLRRFLEAEDAWLALTERGGIMGALAWVEIAKIREHRRRDPEAALAATLAALRLVERSRFVGRALVGMERDLATRAARLRRRISRRVGDPATT